MQRNIINPSINDIDTKIEFLCLLCQNILLDPVTSTCCEELFCNSCIKNKLINICPNVSCFNQSFTVKPISKAFRNILDKFNIPCINQNGGCDTIVKFTEMNDHVLNKCQYKKIECIDCDKLIRLKNHILVE